jgi:cytochrome c biogenesis protein CcmG, thiol:disulfide interchange protein DsbE
MKVVQLITEHASLLLTLFAIGCVVSFVRQFRPDRTAKENRLLKLLEWCLLPPGFAVIFVTLQQESVRYFALHPQWTIAAFLGISVLSAFLIFEKRKRRHALLTWFVGIFGAPGVAFSLILLGLYFQSPTQFEKIRATYLNLAATEGKIAPNFAFTLLSNQERRQLADYRGKVVLLNIWATWCVPCLKEMPDLDKLQKKFGDAGLVVINLSDESLEIIDRYLSKHPMVTTHGRVEKREVPEFYQFGGARPTSFLIGVRGEVIESIVGAKDLEYFESIMTPGRMKQEPNKAPEPTA